MANGSDSQRRLEFIVFTAIRVVLSLILIGTSAFLYKLGFSRPLDEVTVATTNAASGFVTLVATYWLNSKTS